MNEEQPREYTTQEVQEAFLTRVRALIDHWHGQADMTCLERLNGLAFSILATLDGSAIGMPGFIVAPDPHPDDKAYHQSEGENWWPENHDKAIQANIAGGLHELLRR